MDGRITFGDILPGQQPDDLPGRFCQIIGKLDRKFPSRVEYTAFGASNQVDQSADPILSVDMHADGIVLYAYALSLPYLAVKHPHFGVQSIDLRTVVVRIVTDDYARLMLGVDDLVKYAKDVNSKAKKDVGSLGEPACRCTKCGGQMYYRERKDQASDECDTSAGIPLFFAFDSNRRRIICSNCGYTGTYSG